MSDINQSTEQPSQVATTQSPMLYIVAALVILGGIVGYTTFMPKQEKKPADTVKDMPTQKAEAVTSEPTSTEKEITLDEIAKHATKTDCWFAIEGTVYDVTKYIEANKHPGGEAVIEGCGKDATTLFNTRPMGSGTPHSDRARNYVKNFKIGMLKK